jgi:hypothetical protein
MMTNLVDAEQTVIHSRLQLGDVSAPSAGPAPMRPTTGDELTVDAIALLRDEPVRSVRTLVARWFARQQVDQTVPRVRKSSFPTGGFEYRVETASYEAFVLGALHPAVLPVCASEAARLLGCTCERIPLAGRMGVVIPEDCPVHEALAKAC